MASKMSAMAFMSALVNQGREKKILNFSRSAAEIHHWKPDSVPVKTHKPIHKSVYGEHAFHVGVLDKTVPLLKIIIAKILQGD